jgi:hypothetical protein
MNKEKPLEQEILEHIINRFYGGRTFDVDPLVNRIHTFEQRDIEGIGAVVQMLDGTEFNLTIKKRN